MSHKITSGLFFVPPFIDGMSDLPVERLLIGLKNPTYETKAMRVIVDRCKNTFYPNTTLQFTILNQLVILPSDHCTVLAVPAGPATFQGDHLLCVTVEGDTSEEIEGTQVTLFGDNKGCPAMAMVFKHADFIEVEEG